MHSLAMINVEIFGFQTRFLTVPKYVFCWPTMSFETVKKIKIVSIGIFELFFIYCNSGKKLSVLQI